MPAFGYSTRVVNEYGLHELSEVTFEIPLADLRRIAAFLIESADLAESGNWRSDHRHMGGPWDDCGIIVAHPNPDPPQRVR
jgi:hypothetical protein